ncbi:hypothetical protein C2I17_15790 [Niallia circulans]|nr:hypothetical protein C2I17_15790 [Niallia circulans]
MECTLIQFNLMLKLLKEQFLILCHTYIVFTKTILPALCRIYLGKKNHSNPVTRESHEKSYSSYHYGGRVKKKTLTHLKTSGLLENSLRKSINIQIIFFERECS